MIKISQSDYDQILKIVRQNIDIENNVLPVTVLFDKEKETNVDELIERIKEITKDVIDINLFWYDAPEFARKLYEDVYGIINDFVENKMSNKIPKDLMEEMYNKNRLWAEKSSSHHPVYRLFTSFSTIHRQYFGKYPIIILRNIHYNPPGGIRAIIGSLAFDLTVKYKGAGQVIFTVESKMWTEFKKGEDIFARLVSRVRGGVFSI